MPWVGVVLAVDLECDTEGDLVDVLDFTNGAVADGGDLCGDVSFVSGDDCFSDLSWVGAGDKALGGDWMGDVASPGEDLRERDCTSLSMAALGEDLRECDCTSLSMTAPGEDLRECDCTSWSMTAPGEDLRECDGKSWSMTAPGEDLQDCGVDCGSWDTAEEVATFPHSFSSRCCGEIGGFE